MLDQLQEFLDEHGHYVNTEDKFVFSDGAIVEPGSMGRMIAPPDDEWEKSKVIAQYWLLVSQADEQAFADFKSYLEGHGTREAAWAILYTEEEQVAHLRTLQQAAKRSRARYMAAKRKVKANIPFWMEEREQQEVEDASPKQNFLSQINQITL